MAHLQRSEREITCSHLAEPHGVMDGVVGVSGKKESFEGVEEEHRAGGAGS
jgi:hypothetical protein